MKIKSISSIAAILAISAALTGCAGKESSVADSSAPESSATSESVSAESAESAVSVTSEAQTADAKPETAQTEQTPEQTAEAAAEKLMSDVNGTYVPLFDVILQDKYRSVWDDTCLSVLGDEEAAAAASEMLRSVCAGTVYGEEAAAAYADAPESAQFYCGFTEGVAEITFADGVISGVDESGEFTYFLLRTDTPASTCHIELRYGEDVSALLNYTECKYAYWMGSGIIKDCGDEVAENSIKLFCTENLT